MSTEYFLILPNVYLQEPCSIGEAAFYSSDSDPGEASTDYDGELLKNIKQMLFNKGFSGLFTYHVFRSTRPLHDIVLDVRKIMTVFRYVVFEEHPDCSLESLTYYLLQAQKLPNDVPEMRYWLEGVQDGGQPVHFEAPGFREVTRRACYPEVLSLHDGHFLIQRFNSNHLKDKYIIAMERFNRTRKENHDEAEDILNLAAAFEHIFELKGQSKADLLADKLVDALGLCGRPSGRILGEWSKQFYKTRGQVSHGNAFKYYTRERGFNYWEECFRWKHPDGSSRQRPHAYIASRILQPLIERLLGSQEAMRERELDQMLADHGIKPLIESRIEALLSYNEIYYGKLKELVDMGRPFDCDYSDLVSRIGPRDGTEQESILLELLPFFLREAEDEFPDLEEHCTEVMDLIATGNPHLIGVKVMKLSREIKRR